MDKILLKNGRKKNKEETIIGNTRVLFPREKNVEDIA